ncbi:MAG: hypothetical protein BWY91_00131 [bacterium ADurb.BinA028]|nr:MAG: hypothetical protein BWY91_00131 [bacterium ADurb.BinA028]
MVLDHVTSGADPVVVAATPTEADVLGHGDLHVVDVVRVPDRVEQLVGEAQRQDVLDRLLAEVVVDPEHRVGREDRLDDGVELPRRGQVVPERLLDDDPPPRPTVRARQARPVQLAAYLGEEARRDGEVEGEVAPRATGPLEVVDGRSEGVEGTVVVEGARHEPDALGQGAPYVLAEGGAGMLTDGVVDDLAEVLVGPVAPREPDEAEPGRQQAAVGQVVDGRHELLAGQVAGYPEEHEAARAGDPRQPPVASVAQGVDAVGDAGWAHGRETTRARSPLRHPHAATVCRTRR